MFSQGGGAGWCGAVAGGTRQAGSIIIARHAARVTARVVGVRPSDAVAPAGVGALARDRGGAMEGKQRGEWAAELHYSRLVCLRRATAVGAARIGGAAPSVSGGGAAPSGSATIMAGGRRAGLPLARWWPPRLAPPLVDALNRPPPASPPPSTAAPRSTSWCSESPLLASARDGREGGGQVPTCGSDDRPGGSVVVACRVPSLVQPRRPPPVRSAGHSCAVLCQAQRLPSVRAVVIARGRSQAASLPQYAGMSAARGVSGV